MQDWLYAFKTKTPNLDFPPLEFFLQLVILSHFLQKTPSLSEDGVRNTRRSQLLLRMNSSRCHRVSLLWTQNKLFFDFQRASLPKHRLIVFERGIVRGRWGEEKEEGEKSKRHVHKWEIARKLWYTWLSRSCWWTAQPNVKIPTS